MAPELSVWNDAGTYRASEAFGWVHILGACTPAAFSMVWKCDNVLVAGMVVLDSPFSKLSFSRNRGQGLCLTETMDIR